LGIGDWGLGIGDWRLGPIPNPPTPIPNPHVYNKYIIIIIFNIELYNIIDLNENN
jgi:hypothetical protein